MILTTEESVQDVFFKAVRLAFARSHVLLGEKGIHPGQQHLLIRLFKKNGQSQKDLAKNMSVKPATITVMLTRMEKSGLIERKKDENDQRVTRIFITEKGQEVCKEAKKIAKQVEEECFENFTIEEKVVFRRLLIQIRDNLTKDCPNIKCE
ncbi:MarR family transcriptional regulator [Clostridium sp. SHJSY1]|uniref:MarR family winged helix-turn-helix transcriptional regulator n=1 Tax=Clostridium sp. SHJSY1 TaxID=2942483 RepID=UPI002876DF53|nr:MarR family transcriptional regulator [Clostridium sp. SHJSY1]MDS0527184.1 MarR family transcriptional regulator [Clostridium sp. SHJSY1]